MKNKPATRPSAPTIQAIKKARLERKDARRKVQTQALFERARRSGLAAIRNLLGSKRIKKEVYHGANFTIKGSTVFVQKNDFNELPNKTQQRIKEIARLTGIAIHLT